MSLQVNTSAFLSVAMHLALAGCANMTLGEPYDEIDSNPKNALPEGGIGIYRDVETSTNGLINGSNKAGDRAGGSLSVTATGAPASQAQATNINTFQAYQEWSKARELNSADYQEFQEFRKWLEFKKMRRAGIVDE
jgi:hypothetical protein